MSYSYQMNAHTLNPYQCLIYSCNDAYYMAGRLMASSLHPPIRVQFAINNALAALNDFIVTVHHCYGYNQTNHMPFPRQAEFKYENQEQDRALYSSDHSMSMAKQEEAELEEPELEPAQPAELLQRLQRQLKEQEQECERENEEEEQEQEQSAGESSQVANKDNSRITQYVGQNNTTMWKVAANQQQQHNNKESIVGTHLPALKAPVPQRGQISTILSTTEPPPACETKRSTECVPKALPIASASAWISGPPKVGSMVGNSSPVKVKKAESSSPKQEHPSTTHDKAIHHNDKPLKYQVQVSRSYGQLRSEAKYIYEQKTYKENIKTIKVLLCEREKSMKQILGKSLAVLFGGGAIVRAPSETKPAPEIAYVVSVTAKKETDDGEVVAYHCYSTFKTIELWSSGTYTDWEIVESVGEGSIDIDG